MSKYHMKCTKSELERKKNQAPKPEETPDPKADTSDLLAVMNPDRACSCEVMARAVRADVSKYIGLSERRANLEDQVEHENTGPKDPNIKIPDGVDSKKSLPPSK